MRYRKNQRKNTMIGFYVAMGVCLLAVGIAAAASYSGVKKAPVEHSSSTESHSEPESSAAEQITEDKKTEDKKAEEKEAEESAEENAEKKPIISHIDVRGDEPSSSEEETVETAEPLPSEEEFMPTFQAPTSYMRPVGGEVIKEFSGEDPVYSETMRDYRVHKGTDFAAAKGDAVNAVSEGVVLEITYEDLLGNIIVVDHQGYKVRYCGLGSTALVREGDTVRTGQPIGSVLDIPCEIIEPAHLHLEVKKDGEYLDPMTLFS